MSDGVIARYLTGDEVHLGQCSTINAVKCRIAKLHSKFIPDITVFSSSSDSCVVLSDHSEDAGYVNPVPERVCVVLSERGKLGGEYWRAALLEHAQAQDVEGLERAKLQIDKEGLGNGADFCTTVLLDLARLPEERLHEDTLLVLIACSADVNYTDTTRYPRTALMRAAENGHIPAVRALLTSKADVNYEDENHVTALTCAVENNFQDVAQILFDAGANVSSETRRKPNDLTVTAIDGHAGMTRILLTHGANPNCTDKNNRTALLFAAYFSHVNVCELLLEAKANPNHADTQRKTALLYAAFFGHVQLTQLLLRYGAEVTHEDTCKTTALAWATQNENWEVCACLRAAGAER